MNDADRSDSPAGQAKRELVQPTVRVVLALLVLGVVQFLIVRVPGVNRVVLQPDITVATVLYSLLTVAMFGALLTYVSTVGRSLARIFDSFPAIQRLVQLVGVLVVLVWAYQVFWWLPYFRANPAQYDYVFLVLGIVFVGWLGYIAYSNVDELSALLTGQLVEGARPATDGVATDPGDGATDGGESAADTCPDCGADVADGAAFCASCGAELPGA
jgi:uncharacterized protein YacL